MAKLVGAFAASHGPVIARDWDKLPDPVRSRLDASYAEMGRRVRAAKSMTARRSRS